MPLIEGAITNDERFRAHHCAVGLKGPRGLGLSRIPTIKLHARYDWHGRPLGSVLTPGQTHDVKGLGPLFRMLDKRFDTLMAVRGYDADTIRADLAATGAEAVISTGSNSRVPSRMIATNTLAESRRAPVPASSRTGGGLPPDTTKPRNPTSALSHWRQSHCEHPSSTTPTGQSARDYSGRSCSVSCSSPSPRTPYYDKSAET